MSAILKALKKLEQDTATTAGALLRREAKRHNQRGSKSVMVPVLIGVTISALVVVGLMMVLRNHSVESALKLHQPSMTVSAPVFKNSNADQQIPKNLSATIDPKISLPVARDLIAPRNVSAENKPDRQPRNKDINKSVDAQPIPHPPEISSRQPHQILNSGKNFQNNEFSEYNEPVVTILDDESLKLQAISWSSDSAQRMAVINGKICREKDRVDGYVIKKISSGDVILAKGSVLGKLVFKIR